MASWLHLGIDILQEFAEAQMCRATRMTPEARDFLWTLRSRITANASEWHQRRVIAARQQRRKRASAVDAKGLRCLWCEAVLVQNNTYGTLRTRYCSKKCGFRFLKRQKLEAVRMARELERAPILEARAPCLWCGQPVTSKLLRAVHCSNSCANKTSKQRRRSSPSESKAGGDAP